MQFEDNMAPKNDSRTLYSQFKTLLTKIGQFDNKLSLKKLEEFIFLPFT